MLPNKALFFLQAQMFTLSLASFKPEGEPRTWTAGDKVLHIL